MGTPATKMLGRIAIPTQKLKSIWISASAQHRISFRAILYAILSSTTIYVVNGQKGFFGFTAACTSVPVRCQHFYTEFVTHLLSLSFTSIGAKIRRMLILARLTFGLTWACWTCSTNTTQSLRSRFGIFGHPIILKFIVVRHKVQVIG